MWDFRSYATIQTVWGETESYHFSPAPAQRPRQAQWTAQPARTAQNGSERVNSGLRRATNIVTVDIILIVISLRDLKIFISLGTRYLK